MRKAIVLCVLLLWVANAQAAPEIVFYEVGYGDLQGVLNSLGYPYVVRNASNPVTPGDLASNPVVLVSWRVGGDMSGLPSAMLAQYITGNILITGHDPDIHASWGNQNALRFLDNAIQFGAEGPGTGLVALSDVTLAFDYLPAQWGISATSWVGGNVTTSFTTEGLASGVFDGLSVNDMSYWGDAYHTVLNTWGPMLVPYEFGDLNGQQVVITIGTTVIPAPGAVMLVSIGFTLVGWLRRRRTL